MPHNKFILPLLALYLCSSTAYADDVVTKRFSTPKWNNYSVLVPEKIATDETPFKPSGMLEGGGNYHAVSNDFGDWSGQYLKGELQFDKNNRWNAELLNQREFGDTGQYGAIGNTHIFNEDWYSVINVGAGINGDFLPRHRVDAFINRKWMAQRQLVTTLGIGEYKAMDSHDDKSLFLGTSYYAQTIPWIFEAGIRFNQSDPGNVNSISQFVAVTQGRDKEHFITLRYGFGKEAYQIISSGQTLSEFNSQEVSLQLRKWVGSNWGFNTRAEYYDNPNYNRAGITFGIFKEF